MTYPLFDRRRFERALRIKIHAEIGNDSGSVVLQDILLETGELVLLP